MKPMPVTFYLYAGDDVEIRELEDALYSFVVSQYNKGVLVTANGLKKAVRKAENNPIVPHLMQ